LALQTGALTRKNFERVMIDTIEGITRPTGSGA
jgi:hypothetical protein